MLHAAHMAPLHLLPRNEACGMPLPPRLFPSALYAHIRKEWSMLAGQVSSQFALTFVCFLMGHLARGDFSPETQVRTWDAQ